MTSRPRLVAVGGGILGTMHAVEAVARGYDVVQIERDGEPRGASVRNFGLVWVSGRAEGAELALALRSRELWQEVAAGLPDAGFRPNGSLTIARSRAELDVLEEVAAWSDAGERGLALLAPDEIRRLHPAVGGDVVGALWCALDAVVEPRRVLGAVRSKLGEAGSYTWLPGRHVVEARAHVVRDDTGEWHSGDLVVCCIGATPSGLLAQELAGAPLRRVRLQMLETAPFAGPLDATIADGDSLRYYPAFAGPALGRLEAQSEVAARWRAQLLLVRRAGGQLTIGDTHADGESATFDLDDEPYAHLLATASSLLGVALPPVERRWAGVYSQVTDGSLYYRRDVAPGVVVVTGPGGRGMTLAPAIAEETFRVSADAVPATVVPEQARARSALAQPEAAAGRGPHVEVVCLDMAGTTVADGGLVEEAFLAALDAVGVPADDPTREGLLGYVRATMGTSKIAVFRALLGDGPLAEEANQAFEGAYGSLLATDRVAPLPGAVEAITALRSRGTKVALCTGFSRATRDALLDTLGWGDLADLVLCPSDAGRGRPYPDMVLTAALRLGASATWSVAVAGDTAADMESGARAGASVVAGVLTGADGAERLLAAGATHVLASVAELPGILAGR